MCQVQPVETGPIISSVPTRSLGTSMHAPGNEMVDDSASPASGPIPATDDAFNNAMSLFFTTLSNRLQPLMDKVEHLSNIVDGRTRPKYATTAQPPSHSSIPTLPTRPADDRSVKQTTYPKPASGGGDSGGRKGSPQGEVNGSGQPSSNVQSGSAAANLNPITAHEEGGETRAPVEQSDPPAKSNRKSRARKNAAIANARVPGAAPTPATNTTQNSSRIAPTFVQVTTAQMLRRQDEAKGFRVATSKAQNRKESGMPRKGNAISQAGTTEVTVIRFGGLENRDEEASLLRQHPSSFVEAAQRALNRLSKHSPPTILKGRWSSTSDRTGNFVYTLSGTYAPDIIESIKAPLCSPFKGQTTLVPANGWT